MKQEYSAAGIVICKKAGKLNILLIKDRFGKWTWPKGHIEKGETPQQAAEREIKEEVGIESSVKDEIGVQKYIFESRKEKIDKTVTVFTAVGSIYSEIKVQTEEIEAAKWFTADKAIEKIEYEGSKELLIKAIEAFCEDR